MPELLTVNDLMMCPHGGSVSLSSTQAKLKADSAFVLLSSDVFVVAGCAFAVPAGPHPCMTVEWQNPSLKCKAGSEAVLTTASIGLCKAGDQAPQGTVIIQKTQMKVSAQ
jgi:hypothetical protein